MKLRCRLRLLNKETISKYVQTLQSLWLELDHHEYFEAKHTINATLLKRFKDNDIIYNFLAGLNNEFDPINIRVLKKELSSLNETITSFLAQATRG